MLTMKGLENLRSPDTNLILDCRPLTLLAQRIAFLYNPLNSSHLIIFDIR